MSKAEPRLDEHTLAAYLSNGLSKDERAAVTAALVRDPEARELLKMALHALRAVDRPPVPLASIRHAEGRLSRRPGISGEEARSVDSQD